MSPNAPNSLGYNNFYLFDLLDKEQFIQSSSRELFALVYLKKNNSILEDHTKSGNIPEISIIVNEKVKYV